LFLGFFVVCLNSCASPRQRGSADFESSERTRRSPDAGFGQAGGFQFASARALSREGFGIVRGQRRVEFGMFEPRRGFGDVRREIASARGIYSQQRRGGRLRRILEVRTQDVFPVMNQLAEIGRQFDLILADPPYGEKNVNCRSTSFARQLLDDKNLPKLLASSGRFVLATRSATRWKSSRRGRK